MEDKSVLGNEPEIKKDFMQKIEDPIIIEELQIEELNVDGICGVY